MNQVICLSALSLVAFVATSVTAYPSGSQFVAINSAQDLFESESKPPMAVQPKRSEQWPVNASRRMQESEEIDSDDELFMAAATGHAPAKKDLVAAPSHHHGHEGGHGGGHGHGHGGHHGQLDMGAYSGHGGAFGWYADFPVGKGK